MLMVPLILIGGGLYLWLSGGDSVATDNAYLQLDRVSVSAEVGGRIVAVAVRENQRVRAGDLLFRIDPEPYQLAIYQAEAEIAGAEARVSTLETTASASGVDIAAAQEAVDYASAILARERELMARGFNTRARMDAAEHGLAQARGTLAEAQAAVVRARAQLATGSSRPGINPGILVGRARRAAAALQLARTEVRAPMDGVISQADRLQVGQTVVTGVPTVTIVGTRQPWVEANFKETDLGRMRVGQRATLSFDAYPGVEVSGHVQSIGAGTGSEFSVLPAQNATGNWVKVTQRVPVRIAIDRVTDRQMIAGLSVHVRVHFDAR